MTKRNSNVFIMISGISIISGIISFVVLRTVDYEAALLSGIVFLLVGFVALLFTGYKLEKGIKEKNHTPDKISIKRANKLVVVSSVALVAGVLSFVMLRIVHFETAVLSGMILISIGILTLLHVSLKSE